ncbi:hypothetical protein IDG46_12485 [Staphylococcus sp. EG-SA-13]|nr:hypothetical protein [Staphylococcus sp. EG-SA-13]
MTKPTRDEVIEWAKNQNLDVDNFIDELDQYKTAHNKLTAGLKEAVAESIKYKRERDTLITDIEKLREEVGLYSKLKEHIRLKALHNPSVSRYKDLMHFIDELEGGFYER